jgi:hypothetical protein
MGIGRAQCHPLPDFGEGKLSVQELAALRCEPLEIAIEIASRPRSCYDPE